MDTQTFLTKGPESRKNEVAHPSVLPPEALRDAPETRRFAKGWFGQGEGTSVACNLALKKGKSMDAPLPRQGFPLFGCSFLLTVGSFLLSVELFYLQLRFLAFYLQLKPFYLQLELFCLQSELFCLQWESSFETHLNGLQAEKHNCKQENSNCK